MAPDELSTALDVADALNGELPHWHRGRPDLVPAEPANEEFERKPDQAKWVAAGLAADAGPADDEKE